MSWSHIHADDGKRWVHPLGWDCSAIEATGPINVIREAAGFPEMPPEKPNDWAINMFIRTDNTKKADEAYWELCKLSRDLRPKNLDHVGVSCYRITEEDEEPDTDEPMTEFHDENTLVKVRQAIKEINLIDYELTDGEIDSIITSMQNYGILFRERN